MQSSFLTRIIILLCGLSASAATHPGFLLNQQEIDQLKIKITQAGYVQDCWLKVKSLADASVASSTLYTNWRSGDVYNQQKTSHPVAALGMSYALTGNISYATKAANVLRAFRNAGNLNEAGQGPIDSSGFSGYTGSFIYAFMFTYDLIYNSGALSATDKANIEGWFKSHVPFRYGYEVWAGTMTTGVWENWYSFQYMHRNYVPPEIQSQFFYVAALGYLLEDPKLIEWGVNGNGYPFIHDRHATKPSTSQNPFSVRHFIFDGFSPSGNSPRLMLREGSFQYYHCQLMAFQVALEAAWHRGTDLWRYRDPITDNSPETIMDYTARYVLSKSYYMCHPEWGFRDGRYLFELPNSHFQDDISGKVLNYTGPYGNGQTAHSANFRETLVSVDILGRVLPMIGAIDRSNPSVSLSTNPGPLTTVSGNTATSAPAVFEVTATPLTVQRNDPITVTIRAIDPATGATKTDYVSNGVKILVPSWSPAYMDYTNGLAYNGSNCPPLLPPRRYLLDTNLEPTKPDSISFTAADKGIKTTTVRLKAGGVGKSYRLEVYDCPVANQYPLRDITSPATVRGWSNRIFVGTASVGIEKGLAQNFPGMQSGGLVLSSLTKNAVLFRISSSTAKGAVLNIFDLSGRLIEALPVSGNLAQWKPRSIPGGLYLAQLTGANQRVSTIRFAYVK